MTIMWDLQMMEFLKKHGWSKVEDCYISHPLYPLLEDISTEILLSTFVTDFYGKSWKAYKSLVEFYDREESFETCSNKNHSHRKKDIDEAQDVSISGDTNHNQRKNKNAGQMSGNEDNHGDTLRGSKKEVKG